MTQIAGQQRQNRTLAGGIASDEARRPELQDELNQLDGAINVLSLVANELTSRMAMVLTPAVASNTAESARITNEAVLSPLGDEIRAKRRGIDEITRQLRAALDALAI
jgi:flagellar hook-length control protein FliK